MAEYIDKYIEEVFYVWYETGKTIGTAFFEKLHPNENGNKPGASTVKKWVEERGWEERADALEAKISVKLDDLVIDKRIKMYERLAEVGEFQVEEGFKFLKKNGIKKEETALRAISDGADLQKSSVGVSEALRQISNMTPDQLDNAIQKLLGQKKENEFQIIEGDTVDVEPKE